MSFTQFDAVTVSNASPTAARPAAPRDEAAMRLVASQFEALLLKQLTSSLNPTADEDEEGSLFGNSSGGGGMGLARQMFSEQLAETMARNGGVGLADVILQQLLPNQTRAVKSPASAAAGRALTGARMIKEPSVERMPPHAGMKGPASAAPDKMGKVIRDGINAAPVVSEYPEPYVVSVASDENNLLDVAPANTSTGGARIDSVKPAVPEMTLPAATRPRRVFAAPPQTVAAGRSYGSEAAPQVALQLPVNGQLRSRFGARRDPINGHTKFHKGVDIAAPRGTPIRAAAEGVVVFAGRNGDYGNSVVIKHADGRRTRYAHAERVLVSRGDFVSNGQTVATVGSTGRSTGPHVHFEVLEKGQRRTDPLRALANDSSLARR